MDWLVKLFADFFMAIGFIVVLGVLFVVFFMNGDVNNFSTEWVVLPALLFAWLRGEFYHWPREKRNTP